MHVAFPCNRNTLLKLAAWRRAGRSAIGNLHAYGWFLARRAGQPDDEVAAGERWVVSDNLTTGEAEQVEPVLHELSGVDWHVGVPSNDANFILQPLVDRLAASAAETDDANATATVSATVTLALESPDELPLDAFLLVVPWEREPARPRDVMIAVRTRDTAERVVADLCAVADTTVLEGARCAVGIPGPWVTQRFGHDGADRAMPAVPAASDDDYWFRIAEPPYFLLRRWLDPDSLGFGPGAVRVYCLTPPSAPQRPHLWVAWGSEPALVQQQIFDPADLADQMILVAPFEPLRLFPVNGFGPLGELLTPDESEVGRLLDGGSAPLPTLEVPVRVRPRSRPAAGRLWRVTEQRLRDEFSWYERLPEGTRRNLQFAACTDRNGEAILYLTEQVRGKSVDDLAALAEPLQQVPGLPNCYITAGWHLVPEVPADTLKPLIWRAADASGLAENWLSTTDDNDDDAQRTWLEKFAADDSALPLAILDPETVDGGLAPPDWSGNSNSPLVHSTSTATPTVEDGADPWGDAATSDGIPTRVAVPVDPSSVTWRVWFLSRSAFRPFDQLGSLLLRGSWQRLRALQASSVVVAPTTE